MFMNQLINAAIVLISILGLYSIIPFNQTIILLLLLAHFYIYTIIDFVFNKGIIKSRVIKIEKTGNNIVQENSDEIDEETQKIIDQIINEMNDKDKDK